MQPHHFRALLACGSERPAAGLSVTGGTEGVPEVGGEEGSVSARGCRVGGSRVAGGSLADERIQQLVICCSPLPSLEIGQVPDCLLALKEPSTPSSGAAAAYYSAVQAGGHGDGRQEPGMETPRPMFTGVL